MYYMYQTDTLLHVQSGASHEDTLGTEESVRVVRCPDFMG